MKKVLFVSHLANFSKFNIPFMKWFQEQGWEVHYASLDEELIRNCNKHFKVCFNRSPYSIDNIKAYHQLKYIINTEHYDIIHCHTPMGGVVTRLAAKCARKNGTKVIYTAHGFHFYKGAPKRNWILYYTMEKYLANFTDCLITINNEDYQTAISRKFKAGHIEKINGVGVDLKRFQPVSTEEKMALRSEYGFSADDYILIYVAEFIKRKDHRFIINALPNIAKQIPNLKLIFAGCGETLNECVDFSKKMNLENKINFVGYRKDVNKLYQLADCLITSSKQEGLPINIIEGMASGLPIICANIRGQSDIVKNQRNGFLYSLNNEEEFVNRVLKIHNDVQLSAQIKSNNLEDVKKYSLDKAVAAMAKIYRDTI
ncbi:glycosyltransferase family 4 protein [Caproiciproducens sp. R2]|uniref:glycosyltransferase family 4 protein n=1 Tax=Caproiciproducens sp. R2 TaxID=3435187 RepID=UPI0040349E91